MSSRKRPSGSRSRGNSPPEKRNCPPARRSSLQDRYAATRNPTPTTQQHIFGRAEQRQEQTRDPSVSSYDSRFMSPRSIGSGASTPVHHAAPTAPSMLPQGGDSARTSYLARIQQHETATGANGKLTMDSLRKIRERTRAVASNLKATSMASNISGEAPLEDIIKDLQTEIAQLKKERLVMAERLDALEQHKLALQTTDHIRFQREVEDLSTLSKKLESNESKQTQELQHVLSRQAAIEDSVKGLATMTTEMSSIQSWKSSMPTTAELKGLFDTTTKQSDSLEAVISRQDQLEGTVRGLLGLSNEVASLKTWQESQPTETDRRALVTQELAPELEAIKQVIEARNETTKTALVKRIDDRVKSLSEKHSELIRHINKHIGPAKQAYDRTENSIIDRIDKAEVKMESLLREVEDADRLAQERISQDIDDKFKALRESRALAEDLESTVIQIMDRLQQQPKQPLGKLVSLDTQDKPNEKIATDMPPSQEQFHTDIAAIDTELHTQLPEDGLMASMQVQLDSFDKILEKLEKDAFDKADRISVLEESVPRQFNEKFDPLQQKVQWAIGQIDETKKAHTEISTAMHTLQESARSIGSSPVNAANAAAAHKQDFERLQSSILYEKTKQDQAISDLKSRLATKAEADAMIKQMDSFRLTLRNLQDQYANITSDDVHQKMVHWFLQMYPSNSASMVQQVASIKQDVSLVQSRLHELQALLNKERRVENSPEDSKRIEDAHNIADAAVATAKEVLSKVDAQNEQIQNARSIADAAVATANKAFSKVDAQIDSLHKGLPKILQDMASASSPFVTNSAMDALNHSFRKVESQMEKDTQLMQQLMAGLAEFHEVNLSLIQPNKVFLPKLGEMYIAIAQLQDVLESVNENSSAKEPVHFKWTFDLTKYMEE
ncbi:hypothetical protein J1614_000314 [Plenodomus biglobosus]|nr:hypothetical protein J1614_000314 [Plenodomus biglobosus]